MLEVDGRHHYATSTGEADPPAVRADALRGPRRLRLAGYEVYGFGGAELMDDDVGRRLLEEFFDKLLDNEPRQV